MAQSPPQGFQKVGNDTDGTGAGHQASMGGWYPRSCINRRNGLEDHKENRRSYQQGTSTLGRDTTHTAS